MDYGYLQYKNGGIQAIGGKLKRKSYLYQSTDLMWDGDVNPEGFATKYTAKNAYGKAYAAAGVLVLDDNGLDLQMILSCTMGRLVKNLSLVISMVR